METFRQRMERMSQRKVYNDFNDLCFEYYKELEFFVDSDDRDTFGAKFLEHYVKLTEFVESNFVPKQTNPRVSPYPPSPPPRVTKNVGSKFSRFGFEASDLGRAFPTLQQQQQQVVHRQQQQVIHLQQFLKDKIKHQHQQQQQQQQQEVVDQHQQQVVDQQQQQQQQQQQEVVDQQQQQQQEVDQQQQQQQQQQHEVVDQPSPMEVEQQQDFLSPPSSPFEPGEVGGVHREVEASLYVLELFENHSDDVLKDMFSQKQWKLILDLVYDVDSKALIRSNAARTIKCIRSCIPVWKDAAEKRAKYLVGTWDDASVKVLDASVEELIKITQVLNMKCKQSILLKEYVGRHKYAMELLKTRYYKWIGGDKEKDVEFLWKKK
jgi:hypothetical protein